MKKQYANEWLRIQRESLEKQAPYRAIWWNNRLPQEVHDEAKRNLRKLLEETHRKLSEIPPGME